MNASSYGVSAYLAVKGLNLCKALCNDNEAGSILGKRVSVVKGGNDASTDGSSWTRFSGKEERRGGRYSIGAGGFNKLLRTGKR